MDDPFQITPKKEAPGLSVKELFFKYIRFLPLFILSVVIAMVGAFLYLRYTTPVFQANGALIVKKDAGPPGAGSDPFQQMFVMDNSINIQNEIELLKSQPVMQRVVEGLNLNVSYFAKGNIIETNNYKDCPLRLEVLNLVDSNSAFTLQVKVADDKSFYINDQTHLLSFGQAFQNSFGSFRLSKVPYGTLIEEYKITWLPTPAIANSLLKDLLVAPKGATGILLISLQATHPQLAADVINRLMHEYQIVTREDKNEANRRMIDFIDGRLKGVERELDSTTSVLLNFQRANNLMNPETQSESYFSRIEETDKEKNTLQVQEDVARIIDDYLRDAKNTYTLVPSTLGLADGTLAAMISAYNVAQLERKALIDANVPVTNERVEQMQDRIERLRINILESLRNLRNSNNAALSRLNQTASVVRAQINALPQKEQEMLEIKTQQQTKQTVFNLLMEKREQTAILLAGTISNMKVVEPAVINRSPVKPNPNMVRIIALVIGLALPAIIIFTLELLNDKVNSRFDIEKSTPTPIAGEIGHSLGKEPLVVKPNNRSIVAEQFRILRSNLQYFLTNVEKPVILITSSFSGEGKSYISTNLGAVMSLAQKKTIVLEFDIRKPKVLSHLGIAKKPGIINYLLGKTKLEELPVQVPGYEHLYVLPCGPIPPNPAELLLDEKLDKLFAYLKEQFDFIIIDTAPVGMVSDAMALSKYANSTLYIVRQGYTHKKQIALVDEFNSTGKLPKISIILNDVKARTGYGYYAYGQYGYGEKSGYFEEDEAPTTRMDKWFGRSSKKRNKKEKA